MHEFQEFQAFCVRCGHEKAKDGRWILVRPVWVVARTIGGAIRKASTMCGCKPYQYGGEVK